MKANQRSNGDVRGLFTSCALLSDRQVQTLCRPKSSLECKGRLSRMTQREMEFRMFRAERRVVSTCRHEHVECRRRTSQRNCSTSFEERYVSGKRGEPREEPGTEPATCNVAALRNWTPHSGHDAVEAGRDPRELASRHMLCRTLTEYTHRETAG